MSDKCDSFVQISDVMVGCVSLAFICYFLRDKCNKHISMKAFCR